MSENRVIVDLEDIGNSCFVVMPFHRLFNEEYKYVIRPAVEQAGLECVRGDELFTRQEIVRDIWSSIRAARVVVAELTGGNPNVMYETGLAHAIGKPIVFLTRTEQDVPFDLHGVRYVFYDTNDPFWGEHLRTDLMKALRQVLEAPTMGKHLDGIEIQVTLPETPEPVAQRTESPSEVDFAGVWYTVWESIKTQREHKATLEVPPNHGAHFTASMTIVYERTGQSTEVQETLTGTVENRVLSLTGVSYTYVKRGNSLSYSLDSFELTLSEDCQLMRGKAILRNGTRDVVFKRSEELAS